MSPLLQRDRAAAGAEASAAQVGAVPVVDLLPESVRGRRALRALRAKCLVALVLVVLVLIAALAWGMSQRADAQSRRTAAEVESDRLAAEVASYADVSRTRTEIAAVRGAITDGMRNEVLWADLVRHFQASLPDYADIESLSISIMFEADYLSGNDGPFDPGEAIGEVSWVVDVPTLEQSGDLIAALNAADGFIGATFTTIDRNDDTGKHRVNGTVHLDGSLRSNRFVPESADDSSEATDTAEEAAS